MDVIAAGGGPVGLMTAALLDVARVRLDVYERGSEPTRQSRGTAMHPRTLEVLTMTDAGDGRRISNVLLAPGRQVPDTHPAGMPDLLDYRGPDTAFPFTLTLPQWGTEHALAVYLVGTDGAHSMARKAAGIGFHGGVPDQVGWVGDVQLAGPVGHARHHWHQEAGHANVVPPGGSAARVYGTHAGDSQLAAGQARRQKAPFSPAGLSETRPASAASASARTARPGWPGRATPGGGTPPAWPGTGCHTHRPPGLTCNAQRHGHPGRDLRYHRPGKRSS